MSESATQLMEKLLPPSEKSQITSESVNARKEEPVKSDNIIHSQKEIESIEKKEDKIKDSFFVKIFKNSLGSVINRPEELTSKPQYTNNAEEKGIELLEKELSSTSSIIESISVPVDKIERKKESERAVATGTEERILHLTEEIRELRSMILDRETSSNKNENPSELSGTISEKKIKEIRKEIEDISNTMKYLNSSISDLRKNNLTQMNNIMDIKAYQDSLPSAIENKIIEHTSDLRTDIAIMTELLEEFKKNNITERQDIDSLMESNASKNDDIESVKKELSSLDSRIRKEIELEKKDEEISRAELETSLKREIARLEYLNKDVRQISDTVADLKDNMNYMKDSIDSTLLENDSIKTAIDAKIIQSMADLKKELDEFRTEKDASRQELEKDSSKIDDLNKKIAEILESVTDLKDTLIYMRESIDSSQIENDMIKSTIEAKIREKTDEIKKELKEIDFVKNEIETLRAAKDTTKKEHDIDSSNMDHITKKIDKISRSLADMKDNMNYMKESIDSTQIENDSIKSGNCTETSKLEYAGKEVQKKDIPEKNQKSDKCIPEAVLSERDREEILDSTENQTPGIPSQLDGFDISESTLRDTLKPDEYDLRLNKIIRLIIKTEEFLENNNHEDAKKSYEDLKTAYSTVYMKVPKNQIDEIRPKIDRLENIFEKSNRL